MECLDETLPTRLRRMIGSGESMRGRCVRATSASFGSRCSARVTALALPRRGGQWAIRKDLGAKLRHRGCLCSSRGRGTQIFRAAGSDLPRSALSSPCCRPRPKFSTTAGRDGWSKISTTSCVRRVVTSTPRQRSWAAPDRIWRGSIQAEDRRESIVQGPDLLNRDVTDALAQALDVDCSELLDEDPRDCPSNFDLGSERSWAGAPRCRCNDHDRPR